MLHILWLIIKFILIILGILLGLVLLALLAILFVPVRYHAWGRKGEEEIAAKVNVSWLFHGISFWLWYEDRKVCQEIRVLGISVNRVMRWLERRRSSKEAKARPKEDKPRKTALEDEIGGIEGQLKEEPKTDTVYSANSEKPAGAADDSDLEKKKAEELPADDLTGRVKTPGKITGIFKKTGNAFQMAFGRLSAIGKGAAQFLKKIWEIPKRILERLRKITLTIHGIYDKISYWRNFLQDERTKAALRLTWGQLKHLLKHMAPKKISGYVKFGMEDPCVTGEILAGLGMTYPIHKNRIQVVPVFDQKILLGEAECRGRIYGIVLAIAAWKIYFDKNIKYIIKRWNHKEG